MTEEVELEVQKQQKKQEMDALVKQMQQAVHSSKQSEQIVDTKNQEAKMQAVGEIQIEVTEKKGLIETTLKEIQQGMGKVKKLEAKVKQGEKAKQEIDGLVINIKEKRDLLEKAIKDMEELSKGYREKFQTIFKSDKE